MLKDMNILNPVGSLKQLQDQCKAPDLPITFTEEIIQEGWVNKSKGLLQLLFERGWIDTCCNWKGYTENGKMDEMGNLNEATSLKLLLQKQPDFIAELTLIQYYGQELGIVDGVGFLVDLMNRVVPVVKACLFSISTRFSF
jgi:hypothetical protein